MKTVVATAITAAALVLGTACSTGNTGSTGSTGNQDADFINVLKSDGIHARRTAWTKVNGRS
jgi:hypothetical protein